MYDSFNKVMRLIDSILNVKIESISQLIFRCFDVFVKPETDTVLMFLKVETNGDLMRFLVKQYTKIAYSNRV